MKSYELPSGAAKVEVLHDQIHYIVTPLTHRARKLALEEALTQLADLTHQHCAALQLIDEQRAALTIQQHDITGMEEAARRTCLLINNLTALTQEKSDESDN